MQCVRCVSFAHPSCLADLSHRTHLGVEAAIAQISLAIERAGNSLQDAGHDSFHPALTVSSWVGLAGYDRPGIAKEVDSHLSALFRRPIGSSLKVTNDIELLATSMAQQRGYRSAIVLVAGTGSVAMSYERQEDRYVRTARSGGWGPILGDDGSGFDLGKRGLRLALTELEERRTSPEANQIHKPVIAPMDPCTTKIIQHFSSTADFELGYDLLSEVLAPSDTSRSSSDRSQTQRIAEVAQVVVDSYPISGMAKAIVEQGAQSLVGMLNRLLRNSSIDLQSSVLILAGGMLQSSRYRQNLSQELSKAAVKFDDVELVTQPADTGCDFLRRKFIDT